MAKTLIVERDVETQMRDGVILRSDIYRPDTDGPLPVLLQRTPYGKGFAQLPFALMAAERGYAVVIQDTRGRWNSEGENYPFTNEKSDGYDTVEWAAHQPWANGKVGMYGGSYVGYTQFAAAAARPPFLATITPVVTFCNPQVITHTSGAFHLGVGVAWTLLAWALLEILRKPPEEQPPLMGQLIHLVDGMSSGETFDHLPLSNLPLIGREGLTPFLTDFLDHSMDDSFWAKMACSPRDITIPAFHLGGWYDMFIASTLHDFNAIKSQGNPHQKMLIGPWTHSMFENPVGEVDYGLQSAGVFIFPEEILLRWFDYQLKGIQNGITDEPPIRIFVMGANQWRDENEWPLARTRFTPYYLHSGGAANTRHGDGVLSSEHPSPDEPIDTFVYDPRNPVPTRGGALLGWRAAMPEGAYDQRSIEDRPDVLVYTTSPLETDTEVTGPIVVHLWAASTAADTDFTAKLIDVHPDGYAQNIQEGIIRTRFRKPAKESTAHPTQVYPYAIDLRATSNVFKAGHRIRLEISSSNFPLFDRNPNTGRDLWQDAAMTPALQTILHNREYPSHVVLPIIPR